MRNGKPAIEGGKPIREKYLPYGLHWLQDDDINKVVEVLKSNWITTGPTIPEFEEKFKQYIGCEHAVAVNSGTSGLFISVNVADIKNGDEVITTPLTFVATSNCILSRNARPIFADIDKDTFNIDPQKIRERITKKTKAIIPVHFAGQPCEMDEINEIAEEYDLKIIEDAAHSISAEYNGKKIGSSSYLAVFSFHPVKQMTTGEGGMIVTKNSDLAKKSKILRNHGITKETRERFGPKNPWFYEVIATGYNYRMTDIQAALGLNQLKKLKKFQRARERYVKIYDKFFKKTPEIITQHVKKNIKHAWHLYTVLIRSELLKINRNRFIEALRSENIGVNVHYIPVHFHPLFKKNFGFRRGDYPVTEYVYDHIVTLPLFPRMSRNDINDVILAIQKIIDYYRK